MSTRSSVHRRDFLKGLSLTGISLMPGSAVIAGLFSNAGLADTSKFVDYSLRMTHFESLLTLEFYFVNVEGTFGAPITTIWQKKYDADDRWYGQRESYMIVRLPQQHIAEQSFCIDETAPSCLNSSSSSVYAHTLISGYSYLVFWIRFNRLPKELNGQLTLNAETLTNWNASYFNLVVRRDKTGPIFELEHPDRSKENQYPLGYAGKKFSPENFPKIKSKSILLDKPDAATKLTIQKEYGDSSPVTAIEVPWGLILSPSLPDQDNFKFRWDFSYPIAAKGKQWTERIEELWMATLRVESKNKKPGAIDAAPAKLPEQANENPLVASEFEHKGDDLMRLLPIGHFSSTHDDAWNLLPKSMHRKLLVDLYMNYSLKASARKMAFTPLGVCTEIKYRNNSIEQNQVNDLAAWKQSISFGRDQEVKVAELVVDDCFGLKMLLINTTKRRTIRGVSFLEHFFLLMPLDVEKNYALYNNDENINKYQSPNYKCNTSYKKVSFATFDPKRVKDLKLQKDDIVRADPANNDSEVVAFWAKRPAQLDAAGHEVDLEWDFKAVDWHNNEVTFKKKLFLLRGVLTQKVADDPKYPFEVSSAVTNAQAELTASFDTQKPGFSVQAIADKIQAYYDAIKTSPGIWHQIEHVSQQNHLQKVDHYQQYLELLLGRLESDVRSRAGQIEDEVMEEFTIFKKRVLDVQNIIWENIANAQHHVIEILEELRQAGNGLPDGDEIKDFLNRQAEQILADLQLKAAWDKIPDYIDCYANRADKFIRDAQARATAEIKTKLERVRQFLNAAKEYPVLEYFEFEKKRFLGLIPPRIKQALESVIEDKTRNIKKCLEEIRGVERTVKGRIDMYKKEIGFAVYGVEEELENIKQELIKNFPQDWKEKYEKLRQTYHQANAKISRLKTDFIIFRSNLRRKAEEKIFDFYQEYACFPQLHTAQVYVQTITDLVQRDIPIKMKYAEDYFKNQVDEFVLESKNNVAKVFSEIRSDAKELVKTSVREIANELGGLVNPELAADFMTYVKDTRDAATEILETAKKEGRQLEQDARARLETVAKEFETNETIEELRRNYGDIRKEIDKYAGDIKQAHQALVLLGKGAKESFEQYKKMAEMEAKKYFQGLEAKILGSISLKDILGTGFEPPKFDRKNNEISYRFVTEKLQPVSLGPFKFYNRARNQRSQLTAYFKKQIKSGGNFYANTSLTNFTVGIFEDRLMIEFEKLEILTNDTVKNKVSVSIGDVRFKKELAFLEALSKNIQIPGTGITLNISPREITADFAYALPSINGGAFTMANLKFRVGVAIPISIGGNKSTTPIVARFGINGPDDKFVVAAGIWGGRGHFVIETTPKYIRRIDTGIDFGGYLALDLVIAKGEAFLMAGIRYVYMRDDVGDTSMEFYATLSCGGSVTVFGFITVSVLFVLCLRYQKYQGKSSLYGIASVSYSIKIGFFKKSFTLSFSKRLAGTESAQQSPPGARIYQPNEYMLSQAADTGNVQWDAQYADYDFEDRPINQHTLKQTYRGGQWKKFCNAYKLKPPIIK